MSYSPSYSPVIDTEDNLRMNLIDDADPIMNPFYHAQDRESWYAEVASRAHEEHLQKKVEEQRLKKKKQKKSFKNTSFIMRKEPGRARQLIKIIIHDLDGCNTEDINTELDNASVNVQYIVTSDYDEIVNETDNLVGKIVKKLSKSNL